ncbi:MAG: GNAT family N-acetyltransferase [Pseudomonadota bacterium]
MQPTPLFENWNVPRAYVLGQFTLKAITTDDNERDFSAVMESKDNIAAVAPDRTWPEGLTLDQNLIDLAWHQKEFEARRSFAWIIENDAADYLGCVYVYPSNESEKAAVVRWWWRKGFEANNDLFQGLLFAWLESSDWPDLNFSKSP